MNTILYEVNAAAPQAEPIAEAARVLRQGGLVAFPTETVYGLGGNGLDASASQKIYRAKGRPSDNPLIVHIAETETLTLVARDISEEARQLMDAFWPGPLTMIFHKTEAVPGETTGGLDTVAVRMPAHQVALELIRVSGVPIAAPSANASGRPSPTCAAHVAQDLTGRIDMILDGGSADIGVESTIVDMTVTPPMILRPGYITEEMLREVIGEVQTDPAITHVVKNQDIGSQKGNALPENRTDSSESRADSLVDESQSHLHPKAPGMRYRHYAPKAPMTLVEGNTKAAVAKITELASEAQGAVGIIATDESYPVYMEAWKRLEGDCFPAGSSDEEPGPDTVQTTENVPGKVIWVCKSIGSRQDPGSIARNLYRILREFDEEEVTCIFSESFPTDHLGQAIMNRLSKAAGHSVIQC